MQALTELCRLCAENVQPCKNMKFGRFELKRCASCGFQQISPQPTEQELDSLYGDLYFQKSKYTDPTAIELEYKRRHKLMALAGITKGDKLLEIGCGAGQFIATCSEQYNWYGVDVSPAGIELARKRMPEFATERLTASRIEEFEPSIENSKFDGVLIFDTIEHVYDPKVVLEKAAEWLKPGGHLILSTPDIGAPMARLTGKRWPFMTPPEHLSFFTHGALDKLFSQNELKTIYGKSCGKYANLAFIIYKAGRVGMLPKSLGRLAAKIGLGKITLYVPTGDVLYSIAQKTEIH